MNLKQWMRNISIFSAAALIAAAVSSCGQNDKQVIFYTNADDEAVTAMKNALDRNGYEGKYLLQTFGTSELGGKLIAEGTNLEADLITMSSFYIESAQKKKNMFQNLTFERETLQDYPDYYAPITCQEGAIIVNTQELEKSNLKKPESFQDLAKPEYSGNISVSDIQASSTAWLLVQGIVSQYSESQAKQIMSGILENAGPHVESSGSGPIKKVRLGEVAIGFGLRHQAVRDKNDGLPIDYADPAEGNFSLTESVAVIDKKDKTNPLAAEMAECIIKNGREELQKTYPMPIYQGETADPAQMSKYPKTFSQPLTAELLQQHKKFVEECK